MEGSLIHYAWGGFIDLECPGIENLYADGRADIFIYQRRIRRLPERNVQLTKSFQILDKHKIQYVLIPPARPLGYLLQHSPDWRVIYSDKVAVLFERAAANSSFCDFQCNSAW